MTFIYKLDIYPLTMYPPTKTELSIRQRFRKLSYYRQACKQTDRQTNRQMQLKESPRHFASGNNK